MMVIEALVIMLGWGKGNEQGLSIGIGEAKGVGWSRCAVGRHITVRLGRLEVVYFGRQFAKAQAVGDG